MILGIECTAHTFGIGIVHKGKILANIKNMYTTESGGIIPIESAKHHKEVSKKIYVEALMKAGIKENEIEAIAISNAPGLAPCLYAGMEFGKKIASKLKVKMIPVNHCIAHLEIGRSVGAKDPVLLYASGANTQIIAFAAGKYRVFGETLDIGIGNFIDKFARHIGLGFPGGPKIEEKAKTGKYIELPYAIKGMDVSFSGLQTKLQQLYDKGEKVEDLAFSLQETAFAMLIEAAERALAHTGKNELVLGGGVACNSRFQEMCKIMCSERIKEIPSNLVTLHSGISNRHSRTKDGTINGNVYVETKYFCPERQFLVDNAGMIAFTGEIMFNSGIHEEIDKIEVRPRERTDDVKVSWR